MTQNAEAGIGGLTRRLFDSALFIAIAGGAASFAGWTSRMAYFRHFGLDPSVSDVTAVAIGSEGLIAIVTVFFSWLAFILPATLVAIGVFVIASRIRRRRSHAAKSHRIDRVATGFGNALSISALLIVMFAAGTIDGQRRAKDLVTARDAGNVLSYHLAGTVVRGLAITETDDRIWLLTQSGVQIVKADEVRLIDGPLYVTTGVIRPIEKDKGVAQRVP